MEAPKCPICGEKHWSNEPHKWAAAPAEQVPRDSEAPPKFDKRAYQREYMRKRRAEAKARKQ